MDIPKLLRAADAFMTALLWLVAVLGVLLALLNGMAAQLAAALAIVAAGWCTWRMRPRT
ncbi:hypothetical protein [Falsiroseomonas sp. HW251]|uniref:hypothetical protein n=1 Tax=Falsiroseomonas sp. HW251 TaxID=3390998 RepID=UPI003D31C765